MEQPQEKKAKKETRPTVDYTVVKGDTVTSISVKTNTPKTALKRINKIFNEHDITPEQVLQVYNAPKTKTLSRQSSTKRTWSIPKTLKASLSPTTDEIPLLVRLRQVRDRVYFPYTEKTSTEQGNDTSKNTQVYKEHVRYIKETDKILGVLTVTPEFVIFEPAIDNPIALQKGLLACQFACDVKSISDVEVLVQEDSNICTLQLTVQKKKDPASGSLFHFTVSNASATELANRLRGHIPNAPKEEEQRPLRTSSQSSVDNISYSPTIKGQSVILNGTDFDKLNAHLPLRLRAKTWNLLYSTAKHGISINTFYNKLKDKSPTLIVVEDTMNYVFGGLATEAWKPTKGFFGTGEGFLFSLYPTLVAYPWTGKNEFFMYAQEDSIALGGGGGKFGIWVDSDFNNGSSGKCTAFNNACLSSSDLFTCMHLEVWGFS